MILVPLLIVSFSYLLKELVERMKWYKRRSSGEQAYDSFRSRRQQTFSRLQVCCSALWNNEGRNSKCSLMKTPTNAKFDEDSRSSWWSKECRVSSWIGRTFSFDFLFRMDAAVAIVYGRISPVP